MYHITNNIWILRHQSKRYFKYTENRGMSNWQVWSLCEREFVVSQYRNICMYVRSFFLAFMKDYLIICQNTIYNFHRITRLLQVHPIFLVGGHNMNMISQTSSYHSMIRWRSDLYICTIAVYALCKMQIFVISSVVN